MGTPTYFSAISAKGNNFHDFLFASLKDKTVQKGSTLKGRNLLLQEQILFFKSQLLQWEVK